MPNSKILFIVEGKSEQNFINKTLNKFLNLNKYYEIIEYKTSIYELYDLIIKNDDLSLTSILLINNKIDPNLSNKYQLDSTFSYIYLVFDLDIQYHKFSKEKLAYMVKRFSDPTEEGQLLINFPKFESLYDITKDFKDEEINKLVDKTTSKQYKTYVKEISYANINNQFYKFLLDFDLFIKVSDFNKKRYLSLNKLDNYYGIDTIKTFKSVMDIFIQTKKIFVLNMMILLYFEFHNQI